MRTRAGSSGVTWPGPGRPRRGPAGCSASVGSNPGAERPRPVHDRKPPPRDTRIPPNHPHHTPVTRTLQRPRPPSSRTSVSRPRQVRSAGKVSVPELGINKPTESLQPLRAGFTASPSCEVSQETATPSSPVCACPRGLDRVMTRGPPPSPSFLHLHLRGWGSDRRQATGPQPGPFSPADSAVATVTIVGSQLPKDTAHLPGPCCRPPPPPGCSCSACVGGENPRSSSPGSGRAHLLPPPLPSPQARGSCPQGAPTS